MIATNAGKSFISSTLIWTAIVSVAHVFTALITPTGKLLQLVEELDSAAVLPVAALTLRAIVSAVLAAVGDVLHAEPAVDLPPVVVPEALQLVRAIVVRLARLLSGERPI